MRNSLFAIVFLLIMSVSGCETSLSDEPLVKIEIPVTPATDETQTDSGFNLLVVADGEVLLKRNGWSEYHPTAFGAELHRGEQIKPRDGVKAVILCDSLTTWIVPAGVPSGLGNGCPQAPEPSLKRGESLIGNTRGGNAPLIPYIISPRKTHLLNALPMLRWNEVPGASSYTVQVRGGNLQWETEVTGTEMVYSGEPPLKAGEIYLLIVVADDGSSSSDEGTIGLGFMLLNKDEITSFRAASEKLETLNLNGEAEDFALAQLYAGQDLITEAIKILEALAEDDCQETAVYRVLGDLYQNIGLSLLAEEHYLTAIQLTKTSEDIEGLSVAQEGLGEVYMALGNKDEAIKWLSQAQEGYQILGDTQRVNQVAELLEEIDK